MLFTESVYNGVSLIINKERRGVVKPSQIIGAIELACDEILIELTEEYKATGIIPSSLEFYVESAPLTFASGLASAPADYLDIGSLILDDTVLVDIVKNDREWADRLSSSLVAPTSDFPVARVKSDEIQIEPNDITTGVVLNYVYRPDTWMSLTLTPDADGRGKSVTGGTENVKFKKILIPAAIKKALVYVGHTLFAEAGQEK